MGDDHREFEFPPNLDDGEHWIPSDIFLNEVILPSKPNSNIATNNYYPYHHFSSCMEDLATHFAALSLLKNHHHPLTPLPKPPLNLQRVKMAVRDHLPTGFLGVNGGGAGELIPRLYGCETGLRSSRSEPFYEVQVYPRQVDSYLEEMRRKHRVLQRQRSHTQCRVYPFQGSGFGFGRGGGTGGLRESGGTGVFHPRIVNPVISSSAGGGAGAGVKRKCPRSRQHPEILASLQRNSMRRVMVNSQEDCDYHLPSEMDLPQDWAY